MKKLLKKKKIKHLEKVGKQYTLKTEVKKEAEDNIKALFEKLIALGATSNSTVEVKESEKITELNKLTGFKLTEEQCKVLISIPKENLADLEIKIINIIDKVYEKNINENDEVALNGAREVAVTEIDALNLENEVSNVLKSIIQTQIKPNVFYDKEKTDEKIKEVQKNISKVIIKKNQIIVKEGEPVTQGQIDILSELGMLNDENETVYIYVYLALAVFLAIVLFLQYNYIKLNYKEIFKNTKKLILISVINLISLILARTIRIISPFLIPFACAPMMLTLLLNYKISFVISSLNIIIISALIGFDVQIMILGIVNSILGSTFLKRCNKEMNYYIQQYILQLLVQYLHYLQEYYYQVIL